MEPKQETETKQTRSERAWTILHRLIADKREAERRIVEEFHTNPDKQAAVAKLRAENKRRGTRIIKL